MSRSTGRIPCKKFDINVIIRVLNEIVKNKIHIATIINIILLIKEKKNNIYEISTIIDKTTNEIDSYRYDTD